MEWVGKQNLCDMEQHTTHIYRGSKKNLIERTY
jgi:hypothetical protein